MAELLTNLLFEPKGKHNPQVAYNIKDTVMSADGGQVYFALKAVPVGIQLNNAEYWKLQIDLSTAKAESEAATAAANAAAETANTAAANVKGDIDRLSEEIANINDNISEAVRLIDTTELGTLATIAVPPTLRLINKTPVPAGTKIESLTAYFRYSAGDAANVTVALWHLVDGVLECVHTVNVAVETNSTRYETIPVNYVTTQDTYVSIFADKQTLAYTVIDNTVAWRFNDVESSELSISAAVGNTWANVIYIDCKKYKNTTEFELSLKALENKVNGILNDILVIGENGDYTNIQDALDYLANNNLDTASHHWTLLIMPGVYPRFSTYHSKWQAYSTRYVSFIGLDKTQCIIRDDSGEYLTPPAEIRTNGLIKNLQFVATHDSPPEVAERENAKHKAYAVHMDHGAQLLTIEDCIFTSYQAPAIGMGVWDGSDIKFRNCDFNSLGDAYTEGTDDYQTNYTYLTNHGAFFAHANMINGGFAKLTLDNCWAYSKAGNRVYWLEQSAQWSDGNTVMTVECTHNIAWSDAEGVGSTSIVASALTKTGASFGNNADALNA